MRRDVLELAAELSRRGEPFVLATVVWRRPPSSGREGSMALILPDGTVRGWLGGACAEPAVVREALRALEEERPSLMFLGPPDELEARAREGVVSVPIACQSEGALEVYVEPVLARPHLVVIGRSPAVDALAGMAAALGWDAVIVDEGRSEGDHPPAVRLVPTLDLLAAGVGPRSSVVVATQGHYDEEALEHALRTPAAYVGLVASRTRAEAVLGYLRDRGVPEEDLARVRSPAGLDLGSVPTEEIAVAILAELVKEKATARPAPPRPSGEELVDPVCGMVVSAATARYRSELSGRTYYLCSASCQRAFERDPPRYTAASGTIGTHRVMR